MISKLDLYILNSDNSVAPFAPIKEHIVLYDFSFESQRMGPAPEITATIQAEGGLEDHLTSNVFCEYKGERYFLKSAPSVSKDNTDLRYTFELTFVSERVILDNVYMVDAVQGDSETNDVQSSRTDIVFKDTIEVYIARLNAAMQLKNVGYSVVLDEGITSESKLVSFQDKYFTEALQEGVKIYNIPYYFEGKVIHFGESTTTTPILKYGDGLLGISKSLRSNRIVNRATATGGSENIPHYYPNSTPMGEIEVAVHGGTEVQVDSYLKLSKIPRGGALVFHLAKDKVELFSSYAVEDVQDSQTSGFKADYFSWNTTANLKTYPLTTWLFAGFSLNSLGQEPTDASIKCEAIINTGSAQDFTTDKLWVFKEVNGTLVRNESLTVSQVVNNKELIQVNDGASSYVKLDIECIIKSVPVSTRYYFGVQFISNKVVGLLPIEFNFSTSQKGKDQGWYLRQPSGIESDAPVSLADYGLRVTNNVQMGEIYYNVIKEKVPFASSLMPPIYRASGGIERFYNAQNGLYEGIFFENEYNGSNPKEAITAFDIKPTIVGVTNAAGSRIDAFIDFAYDRNDSDDTISTDGGSEEYISPYFYAKLRKFDGVNGFNLFAQAIESGEMMIEMTSGHCGACKFTIMVDENTQRNLVMVDNNGDLVYDDATGKVKMASDAMGLDRQNDTVNNEVWIALKKDINTFGQIMPNATSQLKPSVNDTFVITNILLPQAYFTSAEKKLEEAILGFLVKNNSFAFDFSINFSRIVLNQRQDIRETLSENAIIPIEFNGKLHSFYVSSYTYRKQKNELLPEISVSLTYSFESEPTVFEQTINAIQENISKVISSTPTTTDGLKLADTEKRYLRKDIADVAKDRITFEKGLDFGGSMSSSNFLRGELLGAGFGVYTDDDGSTVVEADKVVIRQEALFNEIVVNQTSFVQGSSVFSAAGCEITSVEVVDDIVFRCFYDNKTGTRFSGFKAGDQARCQRYDASYNSVIKYYWRVVKAVGEDYVDLYISGKDDRGQALATGLGVPEVGDNLVQLGSRTDITRQNAIIISSTPSPTIIQYDGINSFVLPEPSTVISPDNNVFSGVMRIMPGSTGLNDMEEFKDLRSEVNSVAIDLEHTNDEVDRYGTLVDEIKEQADKEYIIWFFDHIPTLTNEPARDWTTEELIELHDQDLFYSKPLGRAWRFVDGQWEEITDADTIAALRESNNATQRVDELEGVINNYGVDLEIVKNQLDKEFTIWFAEEDAPESYVPTNNNYPAVDWNTESLQVLHDQDLFYNRKSGKAWRYEDRAWVEITDADTIAALNKAGEAYDNAERVDHRVDDLAAIIAENKTFVDEVVAPALDSLQKQIDGAIESFFYEVEPTLNNTPAKDWISDDQKKAHLNDTYTNLTDGRSWRWTVSGTTYGWTEITDTATATALKEAGLAKDTADNKRRVFIAQPTNAQAYDAGDLWVNATYGTTYINDLLRCKTAKPEGAAFSISHWELATKYTDDTKANNALAIANESKNYIDKVLPGILDELQNQLDGKVENFFYEHVPTASNEPANAWTTEELKKVHLNDTFTNTLTGQSWRWLFKDGTYKWVEIADTQSAEALRIAMEAKAAADSKITTYYGTTVNPPYEEGDIWVQGSNGDIYVCVNGRTSGSYTASDWAKASKYTDDTALNNFIAGAFADTIEEVKTQIDGKAETWYQASDPSAAWTTADLKSAHIGDLWYNTSNTTTSRWSGSKWEAQSVPSEVFDKIDGKADIFVSESRPSAPYNVNDLWSRGDKGQLMICVKSRTAGESTSDSDWAIADDSHKYADDLKDEIEQNFKDDYEYLTKALPVDSNLATTVANAMVLSSLLGVWDNNKNVVSFLNGSDLGKDSTHGKLMFAAGVPTSGANLASRAANAKFRVYEDGTIIAEQGLFKGQVILGDGKITLNQDGSGSLADGSLTWDKYGIMTSVFPIMEKWQDIFTLTTTGSTYTRVNLSQVGYLDNVCQATGVEDTRSIFYLDTANTTMRDGFTLKMRGAIVYNSSLYPAAIRSWNGEKFYAAGRDDGDISFYPETYLVSDTFFMPLGGPPITLTYKQAGGLSANNPYWIVDFPSAYKKVYINQTDGAIYAQTYLDNMDNPSPLSE